MNIKKLESIHQNTYATITLDANEILDLMNMLYVSDYCDASYNHRKTECFYLYYQLQTVYDLIKYGHLTDSTFKKHNQFLESENKNSKGEKDNG